ncbi:MAG: peptidoglycan DD-metalloendopeptidase family protein [Alphaproteobacteria bacterium]|nr:peptidoglycan DD-metalloendopeptidase family protein [Alphaproteobacteria bacterium]
MRRLGLILALAVLAGCGLTAPDRAPPEIAGAETVVVARGDSVYSLAEEHGVPLRDFIQANALEPPFILHPGQVLQLPRTRVHVVERGENLTQIARRYNASVAELVQLNGLDSADHIEAGQRLRLPAPPDAAPGSPPESGVRVASAPPPSPAETGRPRRLTDPAPAAPVPGPETGSLGQTGEPTRLTPRRVEGIDTEVLDAEEPGPAAPPAADTAPAAETAAEDEERAAETAEPAGPAEADGPTEAEAAGRPAAPLPAPTPLRPAGAPDAPAGAEAGPAATEQPAEAPPAQVAAVPEDSDAPFQWPVQGRLIGRFGPTGAGGHNDGIDIAAEAGTPIIAAADGEVAYAGNELRGYGNLLLIRHDGGWVTAYAHTDRMLVERGDQVVAGQVIATVGRSGSISEPMLHFEIRRGSDAVNPLEHLP